MAAGIRQSTVTATLLAILANLLYVVGYSISKILVLDYGLSPAQVTFLRCAIVLGGGMALATMPATGITLRRMCRPCRPKAQRLAAAALVASNIFSIVSYSFNDVTTASALGFTAPVMLTIMSVLFLHEHVHRLRWLGVATAFGGMLLIVKPGTQGVTLIGSVAAILGAMTYALYQMLVRRMRGEVSSIDIALQVAVVGFVLLLVAMPWIWHPISCRALLVAFLFTAVQTSALICISAALHYGEASGIAIWQFSGLLWAMLVDIAMFSVMPSPGAILGGVLILSGGLLRPRNP